MNNTDKPDWAHIQAFLAVAEHGSLSAAARATGVSQPTMGRQVRAAEAAIGQELFQRHRRGLVLTETGRSLLPVARQMAEAAAQVSLLAGGRDSALHGQVRITASEMVSHFMLPPILADIRRQEPGIALELLPDNGSKNLLFRESDIAVRMYRPAQLDLIARHIGNVKIGMFAARSYVAARGLPETVKDIMQHDFVGYVDDPAIVRGMQRAGVRLDKDFFKTRCDQQVVHWELARAGCGIGFTQARVGQADADMVPVLPDLPIAPLPLWLVAPEALRTNARIKRVFDLLASGLSKLVDA